jgi:hypothetical protein
MPASKYKFAEPESYDHDIDKKDTGTVIGTLRVKPSTILWKPKGAKGNKPFFTADLDEFIVWIKDKNRKASK